MTHNNELLDTTTNSITDDFVAYWESTLGNKSNVKLVESWNQMFNVFDSCIKFNKKGKVYHLILPLITGSGKTKGAAFYCKSLPGDVAALFITNRIEEADFIAEDIGATACSFHSSELTEGVSANKIDTLKETLKYQVVVITHEQYKRVLRDPLEEKQLLLYAKGKERNLIIVDEQINLHDNYIVELQMLESIVDYITKVRNLSKYATNELLEYELNALQDEIIKLRSFSESATQVQQKNITKLSVQQQIHYNKINKFEATASTLNDRKISITELLTGVKNTAFDKELSAKYKKTLEDLTICLTRDAYYYKQGSQVSLNSFYEHHTHKSLVVLDATAPENDFYRISSIYKEHIILYPQIKSRNFANLTINVIPMKTGKSTYLNDKDKYAEMFAKEVDEHTNPSDNVMVVTHKSFVPTIESYIDQDNVVVANWKGITGSNEYRDANIQFIFGLSRKPDNINLNSLAVARRNMIRPNFTVNPYEQNDTTKKELLQIKNTDIIQEVIQAIMRTQARKVIDIDGNCDTTIVYITLDETIRAEMESALKRYLPNVIIKEHIPKTRAILGKVYNPSRRALIISKLKQLFLSVDIVDKETLREQCGLSKKEFTDVIKTPSFKNDLKALNYERQKSYELGSQGRKIQKEYFVHVPEK